MSNTVFGRIIVKEKELVNKDQSFIFSLKSYCASKGFNIAFSTTRRDIYFQKCEEPSVDFYLSDSEFCEYCDIFLAPIYWISDSQSTENLLRGDVENLVGLFRLFFANRYVESLHIYFSDGTAIASDYKVFSVSLSQFSGFLLSQYISEQDIPTIKVVLTDEVD